MQTIGFIGLGMMGGPMAANLAKAGFRVIGHDVRREAVEALAAYDITGATTLRELASADAAIVMVNTDAQARGVIGELEQLKRLMTVDQMVAKNLTAHPQNVFRGDETLLGDRV